MQVVCSAQSTNLTAIPVPAGPPVPTPSTHQLLSSVNQTVLLSSVNQTVSASLPVTSVNASASVIGGSSKRRRRRSIPSSNRTVPQYQFNTSAGNDASNSNRILSRCHQPISLPTNSPPRLITLNTKDYRTVWTGFHLITCLLLP